jgi:hypothetical protein
VIYKVENEVKNIERMQFLFEKSAELNDFTAIANLGK